MLDQAVVDRVRQLDREGFSARAIGRMVPVARGSVANILSGRRPDYLPKRRASQPPFTGAFLRCPTCGAKTQFPCHGCKMRRALRRIGRRMVRENFQPLGLGLKPEDQERYEAVRAAKLAAIRAGQLPAT